MNSLLRQYGRRLLVCFGTTKIYPNVLEVEEYA